MVVDGERRLTLAGFAVCNMQIERKVDTVRWAGPCQLQRRYEGECFGFG